MSIFKRNPKTAYGEREDSSINVFLLVVALAAVTLACFLLYALLSPVLFGEDEVQIIPYGGDQVTLTSPPVVEPTIEQTITPLVPTSAPTLTPAAIQRITPTTAGGLGLVANLTGHSSPVSSVAFSADGRFMASADWSGMVRLWRATNHVEIYAFRSDSNRVDSVVFSPDGNMLAAGGQDSLVRRWDLTTGAALESLSGPTGAVNSVTFSPDGTQIAAASDDGVVYVWDVASGQLAGLLAGHTSYVTSVAFSPDGTTIAAGGEDDTVRLWGLPSGAEIAVLRGHTSTVTSVAFNPSGTTLVSTGADRVVRLWNVLSESQVAALTGHTENVTSAAFSPDGLLLASSAGGIEDSTVRLWDVQSRQHVHILTLDGPVNGVAFSPDGTRLATGGATFLTLWGVTGTGGQPVVNPTAPVVASPVPAQQSGQGGASEDACVLTVRVTDANVRAGPDTGYAAVSTLALNQEVPADGWVRGEDGFTWWRLPGSGWVRGDVFVDVDNPSLPDACWALLPIADDAVTPGATAATAPTATPATTSGVCTLVSRVDEANVRGGPSTDYAVISTLSLNQSVQADGWATGDDGFTWWRLGSLGWSRGDVFVDAANPSVPDVCLTLPRVTP